jgi:hypothetical protein
MLRDIIDSGKVLKVNNTVSCFIKLLESTLNNSTTSSVQVPAETHKELIIIKDTIVVLVKVFEEALKF